MKCTNCKKDYKYKTSYKKHIKDCKKIFTNSEYTCSVCNSTFKIRNSYTRHMTLKHPIYQPIIHIHKHINNNNNIINNNNHFNIININSFMDEDFSVISDDEWILIFDELYNSIQALVKKIHIDTEINQNVLIQYLRSEQCRVVNYNRLDYFDTAFVLKKLLCHHADTMLSKLLEMEKGGSIPLVKYNRLKLYLQTISRNKKEMKRISHKIHLLLLNNHDKVKDNMVQLLT